jgi:outer membrane protein OmpA-like peptidoglycan-associated protein
MTRASNDPRVRSPQSQRSHARERFEAAYDVEVQAWVDASLRGEVVGPTAWDGYAAVAVCEAGLASLRTGTPVAVDLSALVQTGRTIDFKGDTMTLLPSARAVLADVAALLAVRTDLKRLRVEAHTDSVGDDALNQARAQRKAEIVCGVLAEYGVEPSRLVPVGVGEAQPIESNATAEGRALNRRIELHVDTPR